jgi:RNA-directed DNA polymerase
MIAGWLKADVLDRGQFAPTEEGVPQGGVVSPLLLNVALHGMEEAAGVAGCIAVQQGRRATASFESPPPAGNADTEAIKR